ncbi:MAG TPA: methyltransferase domain-containing protein [Solirubrobacteraceae bacterium]|nr:methyltransferase domain-containing protein [Solirubrobacteraceae bacterium]
MPPTLSARLVRPWAHPAGLLGRLAGWEMALGKAALDDEIAALLDPRPTDRVLEVGHGPGTTIARLAELVPSGRVVGVDPSVVMHRQAARRNRRRIAARRVELHVASAERLPFDDGGFDRALTLHSLHHWSDPERGLAEIGRVLVPGGRLLVGLRGTAPDTIARAERAIAGAGFDLERTAPARRGGSTLLVAARSPG